MPAVEPSIAEPFSLAAYSSPLRTPSRPPHPPASFSPASSPVPPALTVAVQGDAVHIIDLSSLLPLASYSESPTTVFASPPLSITLNDDNNQLYRKTFAVVHPSPDSPHQSEHTVYVWTEQAGAAHPQNKSTLNTGTQIAAIAALPTLPTRLALLSPSAHVTLTDLDLAHKHTHPSTIPAATLFRSFIFSSADAHFVLRSSGAIIVCFVQAATSPLCMEILSAEQERITFIAAIDIPFGNQRVLDLACSPSGHVTLTYESGALQTFLIKQRGSVHYVASTSQPLHLVPLSFSTPSRLTPPASVTQPLPVELTTLALNTSHILLATLTTSPDPDLLILILDTQFGIVLASHTVPLSSVIQKPESSTRIVTTLAFVRTSPTQAVLVLSPAPASDKKRRVTHKTQTVLLAVPFEVPDMSSIAGALGRGRGVQSKWLAKPEVERVDDGIEPADEVFLGKMETLMSNVKTVKQAEKLFWDWLAKRGISQPSATRGRTAPAPRKKAGKNEQLDIPYAFVARLLNAILQPDQRAEQGSYRNFADGLRTLLEMVLVHANMITGNTSLMQVLMDRHDWESIQLALLTVMDIPEMDVMRLLRAVASAHRRHDRSGDAMDVDATPNNSIPPLPSFLFQCVSYPYTPSALRTAMKATLSDVDDVLALMAVLESWVDRSCGAEDVLFSEHVVTDEKGSRMYVADLEGIRKMAAGDCLPALQTTLNFLTCLIDATFVNIVQTSASGPVLQRLTTHFASQISLNEELCELNGLLDHFTRAHARAKAEAEKKAAPGEDWRRRRKALHEQAAMAIRVYQVEELVI